MVKETVRNEPLKKKRKSTNQTEAEPTNDPYKTAIEVEQKEALARTNDQDAEIYMTTCRQIRDLLADIVQLKKSSETLNTSKIQEKVTQINVRLVILKKLNRLEKVRQVAGRDLLAREKQKVDSIYLQYENLLYEANYLRYEHKKCLQFKSKDECIDLVTVDEFMTDAPPSLTERIRSTESDHELRLARLEWELKQRVELAAQCKQLEGEKTVLQQDIEERKRRLRKLGPLLGAVIHSTKPVQDHLGMSIERQRIEHELASLLPPPLYVFYANLDAYRCVIDPKLQISIIGSKEEALQWRQSQLHPTANDPDVEETDYNDDEDENKKKRHHRKSNTTKPQQFGVKLQKFLHPLSIEIVLKVVTDFTLFLQVFYCDKLDMVTVKSRVSSINVNRHHQDVLTTDNFLSNLTQVNDNGTEMPNTCSSYQWHKLDGATEEAKRCFANFVPDLGHAYLWAQTVCGLNFLRTVQTTAVSTSQHNNVENVLKTIKNRMENLWALCRQLDHLDKNNLPPIKQTGDVEGSTAMGKLGGGSGGGVIITSWRRITYQDFCKVGGHIVAADGASGHDMYYAIVMKRGSTCLEAFICITNYYPERAPVLVVTIKRNAVEGAMVKTSQNDDGIRDLERVVNCDVSNGGGGGSGAEFLLANQIAKLMTCFDIYLQTEYPQEYDQQAMFIKPICGRNRRKPYKFCNVGVGVFTQ